MVKEREMERMLSAWLDGELDEPEARRVEAWLADDPEAAEKLDGLRAASLLMRRDVDEAEARVDFSGFSARVMDAIAEDSPSTESIGAEARVSLLDGLRDRLRGLVAGKRPILAAAATMAMAIGVGSYYFLSSDEAQLGSPGPLVVRGGPTVIEDLRFDDGSAVIYRTEQDVTVIWVTEES